MSALLAIAVSAAALAGPVRKEELPPAAASVSPATRPARREAPTSRPARFHAVDVFIDPRGKPLAAYQVELSAGEGGAKIVGLEGGEHPAFRKPPYYDPRALMGGRIVIAAFDTGGDLPVGRTRVATLHLMSADEKPPRLTARLVVAASAAGKRISAGLEVVPRKEKETHR